MASPDDTDEEKQQTPTPAPDQYRPVATAVAPPPAASPVAPLVTDLAAQQGAIAQQNYQAARSAAQRLETQRQVEATRTLPPGSTSQFVKGGGQLLGPRQTDEYGIPLPAPTGAAGIRGYPAAAEVPPEMVSPEGGVYADLGQRFQAQQREQGLASAGVVRTPEGAFFDTNTGTYVTNPEQAAATARQAAAIQQFGLMIPAGGGPPVLATPENIDRFNPQIDQFEEARNDIRGQMQDTMDKLQSLSGRRDMYGRNERERLTGQFRNLQQQHDDTLRQQHSATMEDMHRQTQNYRLQKDLGVRDSFNSYHNDLADLSDTNKYPLGSPQRQQALTDMLRRPQNGAALSTAHGAAEYGRLQTQQDNHAQVNALVGQGGLVPTPTSIGERGGVGYKLQTQTQAQQQELNAINKEFQSRGYPFKVQDIFNPQGTGHQAEGTTPGTTYEQLKPTDVIHVPYLNKKGELEDTKVGGEGGAKVSKQTLEKIKTEFGTRYAAAGGEFAPPPAPAAPPAAQAGQVRPAQAPIPSGPTRIANVDQYNAVPPGSLYVDPSGVTRRKP